MSATGLKDSDPKRPAPLSQRATIPPTAGAQQPSAEEYAAEAESIPSSVGQYNVKRIIGQGAMGIVYLAHDTRGNRDVALKIPTIRQGEESETVQRFYREARTAATLSHPNICSIFQVGRSDGVHYIAMQYIEGRPLSDFVRPENPPPVDQVALIIQKLAGAMEQAHQKRIIHRDIKPDNILIDADREPIVMDFGLALNIDMPTDVRLTQAGTIMGSPAYMSPEQIENDLEKIGPAADIYSLGVVFYELLTGRLPFEGSFASVMAQILKDEPTRPSYVRDGISPALDGICLKMMAKSPGERYASMGDAAAALAEFLKQQEKAAGADPSKRGRVNVELSAFDRTKAIRDARIERLEMAKRHVENLRKDGSYNTAIQLLQQLARLRDPKYAEYAQWARELIPVLRAEPDQIRAQRKEAADTARQLIDRHEYKEAVDLLQQIPRTLRTKSIVALLKEASKRHAACERLEAQIAEDFKTHETDGTLPKVERLLELRPQSEKARQWYQRITGKKFRGDTSKLPLPPLVFWPIVAASVLVIAGITWAVVSSSNPTDGRDGLADAAGLISVKNKVKPNPPDGGPPQNAAVNPPPNAAGQPPAGGTIDLLKLIDVKRDKVAGSWSREGQTLINLGGVRSRLQIPFTPPEEYRLNITATRVTGKDDCDVVLGLIGGNRRFAALFDFRRRYSGLHVLDGEAGLGFNKSKHDGRQLEDEVPAELSCIVRKSGVTLQVNGKTIVDWKGDYARLAPYDSQFDVPNKTQLFIGGGNYIRYSKIELVPLKSVKLDPPARKLEVLNAKWGVCNGWIDVTARVRPLVKDNTLPFPSVGAGYPETRPGHRKCLVVLVRYGKLIRTLILPEGWRYTFPEAGHIAQANRADATVKPAPDTSQVEIIDVRWGAREGWIPLTDRVRSGLKEGVLHLNDIGRGYPDPQGGHPKSMVVTYRYRGQVHTKIFSQGFTGAVDLRVTDLLSQIETHGDVVGGQWKLENGVLSTTGGMYSQFILTNDAPAEYELSMTATRVGKLQPGAWFGLALTGRNRTFMAMFDYRSNLNGLSRIDGASVTGNESKVKRNTLFRPGVPSHIVCRVDASGVNVSVNGKPVVDWNGNFARLSAHSKFSKRTSKQLGVASRGPFKISNVTLRSLSPAKQK